jgi:hypothetical protein
MQETVTRPRERPTRIQRHKASANVVDDDAENEAEDENQKSIDALVRKKRKAARRKERNDNAKALNNNVKSSPLSSANEGAKNPASQPPVPIASALPADGSIVVIDTPSGETPSNALLQSLSHSGKDLTTGTAANQPAPNIIMSVMTSLANHNASMARIKQKKLENKITRMKEEQATVALNTGLLAAFRWI